MKVNKYIYNLCDNLDEYIDICGDVNRFIARTMYEQVNNDINKYENSLYKEYKEKGIDYMINHYCEPNDKVLIIDNLKRFSFITKSREFSIFTKRKSYAPVKYNEVTIYQNK